jgi:hypothetical protein
MGMDWQHEVKIPTLLSYRNYWERIMLLRNLSIAEQNFLKKGISLILKLRLLSRLLLRA